MKLLIYIHVYKYISSDDCFKTTTSKNKTFSDGNFLNQPPEY